MQLQIYTNVFELLLWHKRVQDTFSCRSSHCRLLSVLCEAVCMSVCVCGNFNLIVVSMCGCICVFVLFCLDFSDMNYDQQRQMPSFPASLSRQPSCQLLCVLSSVMCLFSFARGFALKDVVLMAGISLLRISCWIVLARSAESLP